jgi:Mg-chelatase subunit ChlD
LARRYLTLGGIVVGLSALPLHGQTDGDRRVIAVNVVDHDGNHVPGLTGNAFRGQFRGEQVRILSAVEDSSSRRIALLVDTSQSMDKGRALSFAWNAAQQLIGSLTPKHSIALFTVGETLQQHARFTTDQRALEDALERAKARRPGESTSLYDGVVRAIQSFAPPDFGDVLYLVSDGMDTTSRLEDRDAERSAARTGIRVFVVRLADPKPVLGGEVAG